MTKVLNKDMFKNQGRQNGGLDKFNVIMTDSMKNGGGMLGTC